MRKRWLVGLLLAVVAASVIGGVVAADTGDTPPSGESADAGTPSSALIDRVAEKLGVDPATLNDAYQQARDDLCAEKRQEWLDALVENGNLTEEQAAEIESWLYAMPDVWESVPFGTDRGRLSGFFMSRLPLLSDGASTLYSRLAEILDLDGVDADTVEQAFRDAGADFWSEEAGERFNRILESLVEQGVLTDIEADDLRQWFDQRPAAADKLPGNGSFGAPRRGPSHGWGHSGRDGMFRGRLDVFENGLRFKFKEDAIEIMPGRGFKWFGPGRDFRFQLPPADEQQPASNEGAAGESA